MEYITIYTTVGSQANARAIADSLLSSRLVACVNIVTNDADLRSNSSAPMESFYHWNGVIESSQETALIAKTRRALFQQAAAKIREIHSYDTPCIVAWPIVEIDADYAAWIATETVATSKSQDT